MRELKDGIRSLVRIDFYGNVHKTFRGTDADKRSANEARVLKVLEERGCPYVPRLLEYIPEENYIVTTNCGRPADMISRRKSDELFEELKTTYGVIHDDPEPRNVTYSPKLGMFCVIDFELAQVLPMPGDKPAGIDSTLDLNSEVSDTISDDTAPNLSSPTSEHTAQPDPELS